MPEKNEKELLTDTFLILDILEKVRISKSLITINIPNVDETFISIILEADENRKYLTIDSLKPDKGHYFLSRTKILSIETRLRGVLVKFNTILIKSTNKNEYISHKLKFPEKIEYHQKRNEHRVNVAIGLHVEFYVRYRKKWFMFGRITDISTGGIGILVNEKQKTQLEQLKQPVICKIKFSNNTSFHCKTNICHSLYDENSGKYQIGTRFEGLTAQDINKLLKIIRILDRDNVKKETRQAL